MPPADAGGAISGSDDTREEKWTGLTQTGNWERYKLDLNADCDFTDKGERDDTGTFNKVNEWLTRDLDSNATADRYLSHDANGNLTTLSNGTSGTPLGVTYVYDAFGRLVQVKDGADPLVNYRYNGLGHRILWQYDVDADSSLEPEERLYLCYDERWRTVATYWDDDTDPKEQFVHHAAGQRGFGGSSYIDSVVLRDRDDTSGWASSSDGVLEERVYYIQNWRADVVALIASDAELLEYVRYSSYGVATSYPKGDYDLDGDVDAADTTALTNFIAGAGGWNLDFNRDGNTDGDDTTEHATYRTGYTGGTGGRGVLSRSALRNRLGYAGYQFDDTMSAYHVRHRVYMPEIGRWTRRDPAGYAAGPSLLAYANRVPSAVQDPYGLDPGPGGLPDGFPHRRELPCAGNRCIPTVPGSSLPVAPEGPSPHLVPILPPSSVPTVPPPAEPGASDLGLGWLESLTANVSGSLSAAYCIRIPSTPFSFCLEVSVTVSHGACFCHGLDGLCMRSWDQVEVCFGFTLGFETPGLHLRATGGPRVGVNGCPNDGKSGDSAESCWSCGYSLPGLQGECKMCLPKGKDWGKLQCHAGPAVGLDVGAHCGGQACGFRVTYYGKDCMCRTEY